MCSARPLCVPVCVSACASRCKCFILLNILKESASKNAVLLPCLLRTVFTDTPPAVLLKLAPAAATPRIFWAISCVAASWGTFYSKTTSFFPPHHSVFVRKRGRGNLGVWRLKKIRQTSPSATLKHCKITTFTNRSERLPACLELWSLTPR